MKTCQRCGKPAYAEYRQTLNLDGAELALCEPCGNAVAPFVIPQRTIR